MPNPLHSSVLCQIGKLQSFELPVALSFLQSSEMCSWELSLSPPLKLIED